MPMVLRIVIDTVTSGSAAKGKIIIRSEIPHDTASSRGRLGQQQDADGIEVLTDRHERTRRREGEHAQ